MNSNILILQKLSMKLDVWNEYLIFREKAAFADGENSDEIMIAKLLPQRTNTFPTVKGKHLTNSVIQSRDLVRIGSYYENSPKASGFFLILKFNSNLPKKTEV